ncbi:MAG: gamma-glutamyl-gamma-aminobutyrate hydrolase family protein [Clostridia bacterium]|nr:gamma-glutamyl-gamma-aminobutyrate hydrolase family protein [Clostridia bacterium]
MKKPVILITGGPGFDRQFHTEARVLNKTYTSAIVAAGGIPVMDLDENALDDYVAMSDGCIFTGTHAFLPDENLSMGNLQVERINRDHKLMHKFIDAKKPVLGICQGFQQLNTAFSGDLCINFKLTDGVEHCQTTHTIKTTQGSLVNRLFGDEFLVNSIHNVRVGKLADCFVPTAYSPDGVLEAYEHKELPVYGFQWHPERMRGDFSGCPYGPNTDALFKAFVEMCISYK